MKFISRLLLVVATSLPLACSAASEEFEAGKHYRNVRAPKAVEDPARIEVAEVFWYGCGHCYTFEATLEKWAAQKPADVNFIRIPSSLGREIGITHSKAYYAAQLLGIGDKVHRPLFDAIHKENKPMTSADQLRELFVKFGGVKAEDFDGAFTGFAVDSRVRIAESELRDMGVTSTPTVVVQGRWMTTGTMAGGSGYTRMMEVVDFLVKKAREEKKAGKK